jgi:DMSO/TMAO reductase YedYZ molybdopterin-dependent catalytic subunit
VLKYAPLIAETPAPALAHPVTPSRHVYVRNNFGTPELPGDDHRIVVGGAVATPFAIAVRELRALPARTVTITMECAGNDRASMRPLPAGEPWGSGAVSTVRWTGTPLRAVLGRAELRADAVEILAEGADAGDKGERGHIPFARSLPVREALGDDVLLAYAMNGEPLPREHGAPVRLVVPGWYGMASVKWVTSIQALAAPFHGYFQTRRYVYVDAGGARPVGRMRVKSVIVAPAEGTTIVRQRMLVWGWAWSGAGAVTRVQVADGGGDAWHDARLLAPAGPHEWARWELEWEPRAPGRHVLRSRATDASGDVQPDEVPWNRLGYGNNAVRPIAVDVR